MEVAGNELLALNDLLTGIQEAQDYEENQLQPITPFTLSGASKIPETTRPIGQIRLEDPKAIWSMDEIPSDDEDDDAFETRKRPKFEILYKQSVMTEDVFLGLSDKDPSSAHCEAMVIRVECPQHRLEDIELDVKRQKLLLLSSTLKLVLYLPHPVRHLEGQAKWDHKAQSLSVSLPIIRDDCDSEFWPVRKRSTSSLVSMALLSSPRLEAIRLIREQLRCTLCGNIFQDPQCLDCKHNFCHSCIILHLRQNHSQCPICQLPTRPSEVTRNQFLESILAAWNGVESELEALNGDRTLHATAITMEDTDMAFFRAKHGAGAVGPSTTESEGTQLEKQPSRGPVANHKWNIDTQGIRQELKLEQPYLPQNYGRTQGSTAHWKKTSSSDLPDDYGGASSFGDEEKRKNEKKKRKKKKSTSLDEESGEQKQAEHEVLSSQANSLMATQEVESYLDRITKQREALSQWERSHQAKNNGEVSLWDLERSLQNSNGFDELIKERRRESQNDGNGDLLTQMTQMTQMPPSTSALESPDLLATFRRRHNNSDNDRQSVKRRVLLSSPPPLHSSGRLPSPSRKRLRMPTPKGNKYSLFGRNTGSTIDLSIDSDDDDEVPDSQPATMLPDAEYKSADDADSDDNRDEKEYEMKPAVPLPPSPEHKPSSPSENSPDRHRVRLKNVFSRKKERASEDFRSVITAFQSGEKHCDSPKSPAAKQLVSTSSSKSESVASTSEKKASPISAKPPIHTSSSTNTSFRPETGSSFVFVGSDLSREEVKRVLEATQQLGGKFGQDFDLKRDAVSNHFCTSVTHLITRAVPPIGSKPGTLPTELRCKRTAKYMRALAEGCFVMDFSWITASLSAGRWLTEEPFEMIGDIYSDAVGKPHEGRLRRAETGRRNSIFSMFCFVLLVSEKEFDFQFASVKALVNNFGGTIVYGDKFSKLNPKQRSRRTPIGVVSKTTLPLDAKAKWQQFRIPIVRITWIFDSVSHLEVLPFDDYYPY